MPAGPNKCCWLSSTARASSTQTHHPTGARCQCGLHHLGPVHLHEAPEEEEAYPDRAGCFFYWDNAPVHTPTIVQDWLTVTVSRSSAATHSIQWTWRWQTSCFGAWRTTWWTSLWMRTPSKSSGKGLREESLPKSLPPPYRGGMSTAKSVLQFAVAMSRKVEK